MMQKILLLTNIYPNNDPSYGGTKVCHSFTTEWQKMGYDVRVVHIESLFPRPFYWVGRFLYKFIQDYGYDHAYTIGALKNVVDKILTKEGYDTDNLLIGHEVGNRYVGDFSCRRDGFRHDITIITDGWTVDYRIDNGATKTYKK